MGGGGDVRGERQGTRVQEAAAPARAVYRLPTLVPLVYTATARARETKRASESEESAATGERETDDLSMMWVCNGMCSGRGRDRVAGTAVRPRGPSTPHGRRTRVYT